MKLKTPLFSAIASLTLAGCGPGGSTGTNTELPPDDPVERRTYMLVGEESVEVDSAGLAEETCAAGSATGGMGSGKVQMSTHALPPDAFMRWAGKQMKATSALEQPLRFVVTENGKVGCVATASGVELMRVALGQDALHWDLSVGSMAQAATGGVSVAAGDLNGDGLTEAALLVPAVQRVRELAAPQAAGGYTLYQAGVAAPAAFEVQVDAETEADLFPAGNDTGSTEALLKISSGGRTAALLLPAVQKVREAAGRVKLVPMDDGVILLASDVPSEDPKRAIDRLRNAGPVSLNQDDVDLILRVIDAQPSSVGDAVKDLSNLSDYWRGVPGGLPGKLESFKQGLGVMFARSADVEGLWAYQRMLAAGELFKRLDAADGALPTGLSRSTVSGAAAMASAALPALEQADYPMIPSALGSVGTSTGHSYALALGLVGMMAEAAPLLVGAPPAELHGIDPDEIDVALKSQAELEISVGQTDTAAVDMFLKIKGLPAAGDTNAAEATTLLAELDASTKALRASMVKLRAVTTLRFDATR